MNNDGYSSIRASQTAYFKQPSIGADKTTGITIPDLSAVGQAFKLKTHIIPDQTDLRNEVKKVLAMPGPVLCDVNVLPDEVRAPRLSSFQKPDGSFVSKPLEDLFPFLPREEFLANMIVKPLPE